MISLIYSTHKQKNKYIKNKKKEENKTNDGPEVKD